LNPAPEVDIAGCERRSGPRNTGSICARRSKVQTISRIASGALMISAGGRIRSWKWLGHPVLLKAEIRTTFRLSLHHFPKLFPFFSHIPSALFKNWFFGISLLGGETLSRYPASGKVFPISRSRGRDGGSRKKTHHHLFGGLLPKRTLWSGSGVVRSPGLVVVTRRLIGRDGAGLQGEGGSGSAKLVAQLPRRKSQTNLLSQWLAAPVRNGPMYSNFVPTPSAICGKESETGWLRRWAGGIPRCAFGTRKKSPGRAGEFTENGRLGQLATSARGCKEEAGSQKNQAKLQVAVAGR